MRFEQFEGVETKLGLWDFECPSKDGAGFVLDEEESAVSFALCDFLEEAKEGDGCEEEARREGS